MRKKRKLTCNESNVLKFLSDFYLDGGNGYLSPTAIGLRFGKGSNAASSWASRVCKEPVARGLIERSDKGHYRFRSALEDNEK